MNRASSREAGLLLVIFPTVIYGGVSLLGLLISDPRYQENALRQDLWRAGHAHAGVLLILALVCLRYVDETRLPGWLRAFVRRAVPLAAILLPLEFFLSVLSPDATSPDAFIYFAYAGAVFLAVGLFTLGIGLLQAQNSEVTS